MGLGIQLSKRNLLKYFHYITHLMGSMPFQGGGCCNGAWLFSVILMDTPIFKTTCEFFVVNIEMELEMNLGRTECVPTLQGFFKVNMQ